MNLTGWCNFDLVVEYRFYCSYYCNYDVIGFGGAHIFCRSCTQDFKSISSKEVYCILFIATTLFQNVIVPISEIHMYSILKYG